MNTPVSFEIAKLLKEKGFNQGFDNDQMFYFPDTKELTENYRGNNYPAPTIADVVMWIYENHNIWISVDRYIDPEQSPDYRYGSCIYYDDHYYGRGNENPTEAYEAAIFYVLNLI
jgi:hypothetical protein